MMALRRLSSAGGSWEATRYDQSTKKHVTRSVRAGAGCTRVLEALYGTLRGGLECPRDPDEGTTPTNAVGRGSFPGSARWNAKIMREGSADKYPAAGACEARGWEECVTESGIVPHMATILSAAKLWYGCARRPDGDLCADLRCPMCWENSDNLTHDEIRCSRFKHGVPPRASRGLGRFKGGNVRCATSEGPYPRAWAVGNGSGEDVEIFTRPSSRKDGASGADPVILAKILYFFSHVGNARSGAQARQGPVMEYVLAYEYVTRGTGRSKMGDAATEHPTYYLQARPRRVPSVFPVVAIRRHVHMFHLCPNSAFATSRNDGSNSRGDAPSSGSADVQSRQCCGLYKLDSSSGAGGKVWMHHVHLAQTNALKKDEYMLNEHWHSAFQDGVV